MKSRLMQLTVSVFFDVLTVYYVHLQGCYKAITDWINDHKDILIGIGAGVAAVQVNLYSF